MPPLQNIPSIDPLFCWSTAKTTLSTLHHVPIDDLACGFEGDDNIYGLGIRLAFYFQWLSAILVTVFIPNPRNADLTEQNFIISMTFTFSTFIALIYLVNTTPPSELYATEVFVVYSLCICGSISGDTLIFLLESVSWDWHRVWKNLSKLIFSMKPKDDSPHQYGRIVASSKLTLDAAIASFSLWYWYTGIDNMVHNPCSRSGFFFKKVDLYHWFRTFGEVISTIWVVWICFRLVASILSIIHAKWLRRQNAASGDPVEAKNEKLQSSTESDDTKKKMKFRLFFGIATLPIAALFILAVELPIQWNHIKKVNIVASTGQLIPLVAAFAGLILAIYESYRGVREHRNDKPKRSPQGDVAGEKTQPVTDSTPNDELGLRPLNYHSGTSSSAPIVSQSIT